MVLARHTQSTRASLQYLCEIKLGLKLQTQLHWLVQIYPVLYIQYSPTLQSFPFYTESSYRPKHGNIINSVHFQQLMINNFSSDTFKRTVNLKLISVGCGVIVTGWKLKKGLEIGLSFQNLKIQLKMLVVSCTNISL